MNKKRRMQLLAYLTTISIVNLTAKYNIESLLSKNKVNVSLDKTNSIGKIIDEVIPSTSESNVLDMDGLMPIEATMQSIEESMPVEEMVKNIDYNGILSDDLVMYSKATDESLKICNLKMDDKVVRLLSGSNGYELVKVNNYIGFVDSNFILDVDSDCVLEYEYDLYNDVVLTTTDLNFRCEPNTDSEIIRTFRINTELEVLARVNNNWLLVNYNGTLGYVNKNYTLSLLDKLRVNYPEWNLESLNFNKVVYVNTDELNIRDGAGLEFDRINKLEKLESVRVIDEIGDWYFVMTNDYEFGYINGDYTVEMKNIFVVVDLGEQRLYLYNNSTLLCVASITSGKDSSPSDKGLFAIWYMGTNEEIVPGHLVDYSMMYNSSMEALHDAERWRSEFGMHTDEEKMLKKYRYNGSNGCINMKNEDAGLVYNNVNIGTKVLVHK